MRPAIHHREAKKTLPLVIQGTTAQHWITSPDSAHSNNLSEAAAAACTPLHFRGVVLGSWRHQTWPVLAAAQRSFWGSSAVGEGNWKSHMEEELEPVDNQNNNVMVYVWLFPPFFSSGWLVYFYLSDACSHSDTNKGFFKFRRRNQTKHLRFLHNKLTSYALYP